MTKDRNLCPRGEFSFSPGVTPLGKYPQDWRSLGAKKVPFPDNHRPSQGLGSCPPEGEASFSASAGGPAQHSPGHVDPGGVFFSFSYLKKKQNSPHSPHVKCCACCRQTIILQSHNDPCTEKRGKACTPPNPCLGESTLGKAQVTARRWGGGGGGWRGGSRKFKGQKKCQANTSNVWTAHSLAAGQINAAREAGYQEVWLTLFLESYT